MWISNLVIIIPPCQKRKKQAENAYLWIKIKQKTGISTTFPQNVDIWTVTMWKCG